MMMLDFETQSTVPHSAAIAVTTAGALRTLLAESRAAATQTIQDFGARPRERRPALNGGVLFDTDYYLRQAEEGVAPGEALTHFKQWGLHKGYAPHPLVEPRWIMDQIGRTLAEFDIEALSDDPALWRLSPHPLFDTGFYLATNPDIRSASINPLIHYVEHGWSENRAPNMLFDNNWYIASNIDVCAGGFNPLAHYAEYGSREGRRPHPYFDQQFYLARNDDVRSSGREAFSHFVVYGLAEGRAPSRPLLRLTSDGIPARDLLALAMIGDRWKTEATVLLHGIFATGSDQAHFEQAVFDQLASDHDRQMFLKTRAQLQDIAVC